MSDGISAASQSRPAIARRTRTALSMRSPSRMTSIDDIAARVLDRREITCRWPNGIARLVHCVRAVGPDDRDFLDRHDAERDLVHRVAVGTGAGAHAARGELVERLDDARRAAPRSSAITRLRRDVELADALLLDVVAEPEYARPPRDAPASANPIRIAASFLSFGEATGLSPPARAGHRRSRQPFGRTWSAPGSGVGRTWLAHLVNVRPPRPGRAPP